MTRAKVIAFEVGMAFLLAMFLSPMAILAIQGLFDRPSSSLDNPSAYWFLPWVLVFFALWGLRQWFMPGQWDGRDLKGMSWRRLWVFVLVFVIVDALLLIFG